MEILGGIGLILFGVRSLRKGLDRIFGGNLVQWLSAHLNNRFSAFASGIAVGTAAPSSTGVALFASQIVSSSPVSRTNMLASVLGANIGVTVSVQLLAFRLEDYAGLLIAVGVFGFQFLKRDLLRGIGQCLLALGMIFLAIGIIGSAAQELTKSADLTEAIALLQGHPLLILLVVTLLAVILQSGTATIGLGLGLASSGLLSSGIMIPWVLGATLGLGVTLLLVGWSDLQSRRMGVGNFITKLFVIIPLFIWPALGALLFGAVPGSLGRQMAMFYTSFNILAGCLFLPLLGPVDRIVCWMFPDPPQDGASRETFLNEAVLDMPSLALGRATREMLRMMDRTRCMLDLFWEAFSTGNTEAARRLQGEEDLVDHIYLDLSHYLGRITEDKSSSDARWQLALLGYANELEFAADLIDKHLCDLLVKQHIEAVTLRPEDWRMIEETYRLLAVRFELASAILTSRNRHEAEEFLKEKEKFNEWTRAMQQTHFERSHAVENSEIAAGAYFLDYLNAFRRINSHLSSIGYAIRRFEDPPSATSQTPTTPAN